MNWKLVAGVASAAVAVLTFLGGTASYSYRAVGNDPMPLEGQKQHSADINEIKAALMQAITSLGNDIKADNLERRIEATCSILSALLPARDARSAAVVDGLKGSLAGYQTQHKQITGAEYPVPMCQ